MSALNPRTPEALQVAVLSAGMAPAWDAFFAVGASIYVVQHCRVRGCSEFRVWGPRFRVSDLGFRVSGL